MALYTLRAAIANASTLVYFSLRLLSCNPGLLLAPSFFTHPLVFWQSSMRIPRHLALQLTTILEAMTSHFRFTTATLEIKNSCKARIDALSKRKNPRKSVTNSKSFKRMSHFGVFVYGKRPTCTYFFYRLMKQRRLCVVAVYLGK